MKNGKNIMIITIGIICFILSLVIFMQFKVTQQSQEINIDTMQEAELRQELANWKNKYEETKTKTDELKETLDKYKNESISDNQTKETLEAELERLELALGTTDVEGEGVIISLKEKSEEELGEDEEICSIVAKDLIYIVNYLKDAGAEAISINDERIINNTDIVNVEGTIKINSKYLRSTEYTIKAIGNSSYLESSIFGKGGYTEILNITGIDTQIKRMNRIVIEKYNGTIDMNHIKEEE